MSIPRLVRVPGPVRAFAGQELLPEDQASTAPKEIMRLVSWLMSHGSEVVRRAYNQCRALQLILTQDQLFITPGDSKRVEDIRKVPIKFYNKESFHEAFFDQ